MDLTIKINDYYLNVRACAIIIHNSKVLVHKSIDKNHYALLGGRVSIGESSDQTVRREVKEELGKDIELIKYLTTVENFFEINGSKYHEILFIHKAEFVNEEDKLIESTLKNIEGKDYIQYEWLPLDKIDEYPLKPEVVKNVLKGNVFPVHKVNNDLV